MVTKEIAEKLNSLIQLDIDAAHSYGQAIEEIKEPGIRQKVTEFRGDHERHVRELSSKVTEMGETPPEYKRDVKGFLLEGFTAIRSMTGTEGALKALETNENLTNQKYYDATTWGDLLGEPSDIMDLIKANYGDEQRHLSYIKQSIAEKAWEKVHA